MNVADDNIGKYEESERKLSWFERFVLTKPGQLIALPLIYFGQKKFLFLPHYDRANDRPGGREVREMGPPSEYGLAGFTQDRVKTEYEELIFWRKQPAPGAPTILFFHGYAGKLSDEALLLKEIVGAGLGVVAVEYPGYGSSTGSPSEHSMKRSARAAVRYCKKNEIDLESVVPFGISLGASMVIEASLQHKFKVKVLYSPFSSMVKRAGEVFPLLPMGLLLEHQFDNVYWIKKAMRKGAVNGDDVLILQGGKDEFTDMRHAETLKKAMGGKATIEILPGVGHKPDPVHYPDIIDRVVEFMQKRGFNLPEKSVLSVREDTVLENKAGDTVVESERSAGRNWVGSNTQPKEKEADSSYKVTQR